MSYLALLLRLCLLLGCALSLIEAQYQARRTFIELNRAKTFEHELRQEWNRLQYEQSALTKSTRIESIARRQLHMHAATPARTHYLPSGARVQNRASERAQ